MNKVQNDPRIGRQQLRKAVKSVFEGIEASYVVRNGFFAEEAIIMGALRLEIDYIILSKYRRDRWKRFLKAILDIDQNPEQLIRDRPGIEVVTDAASESALG